MPKIVKVSRGLCTGVIRRRASKIAGITKSMRLMKSKEIMHHQVGMSYYQVPQLHQNHNIAKSWRAHPSISSNPEITHGERQKREPCRNAAAPETSLTKRRMAASSPSGEISSAMPTDNAAILFTVALALTRHASPCPRPPKKFRKNGAAPPAEQMIFRRARSFGITSRTNSQRREK